MMSPNLVLVDTSVWIEVLPPGKAGSHLQERVANLLAEDRVAITGMVLLELLGGARNDGEYERLKSMVSALHHLPVTDLIWERASRLGFELRRKGFTIPFTDILIAAVAAGFGAELLHRDRHFDIVASHFALRIESNQ